MRRVDEVDMLTILLIWVKLPSQASLNKSNQSVMNRVFGGLCSQNRQV